jgi:hypothetical protein
MVIEFDFEGAHEISFEDINQDDASEIETVDPRDLLEGLDTED